MKVSLPMRWLLLGGVFACGADHGTPVDARTDPAVCIAERDMALDRTCTSPSDCVLVASADCCGTLMIAVKAGTEPGFASVETAYETCLACPPLGCMHADQAEDGTTPGSSQSIVATCVVNRCTSVVQ